MQLTRPILTVAAALAALVVAAPFLVTQSFAQNTGEFRQPPPGGQGGPGGPGGFGQGPGFMGGMPGGAPAMVADNTHVFVLLGNRLIKVNKGDLSIAAEKNLGQPPRGGGGQPGGGFGGPGGGGGRGGGGGG